MLTPLLPLCQHRFSWCDMASIDPNTRSTRNCDFPSPMRDTPRLTHPAAVPIYSPRSGDIPVRWPRVWECHWRRWRGQYLLAAGGQVRGFGDRLRRSPHSGVDMTKWIVLGSVLQALGFVLVGVGLLLIPGTVRRFSQRDGRAQPRAVGARAGFPSSKEIGQPPSLEERVAGLEDRVGGVLEGPLAAAGGPRFPRRGLC
jgi:hypothetical protein